MTLFKRAVNYRFTENIYDFDGMLLHTDCTLLETFSAKIIVSIVIFLLSMLRCLYAFL
jgi:hypothetical protein